MDHRRPTPSVFDTHHYDIGPLTTSVCSSSRSPKLLNAGSAAAASPSVTNPWRSSSSTAPEERSLICEGVAVGNRTPGAL